MIKYLVLSSTIFAAADIVNITITISDVLSTISENTPEKLDIRHAHPNPFNNSVFISDENSKLLINHSCQTSFEAVLANKECFNISN